MMMIQGLNSCSTTTAKTAEIMSRYRPIAPRPENPSEQGSDGSSSSNSAAVPQKINQSPYLRNVWHQLQARPTRTRKRGRMAFAPPPPTALKRQRTHNHHLFGFSTPIQIAPSPVKNLSMQCFGHGFNSLLPQLPLPSGLITLNASCLEKQQETIPTMVTLPLLRSPPVIAPKQPKTAAEPPPPPVPVMSIDLNRVVVEIPEEKDLLQQLHKPISPNSTTTVISPQPIRPVGSSISVVSIKEDQGLSSSAQQLKKKAAEEVEEEVELEALPAVVSDSKNRVRLANSAYKEMVGQPECSWLDSIMPCNRICGEVVLQFPDAATFPVPSKGFSCWVTIQWLNNGSNKSVRAFCDVSSLCCDSKDYLYVWRFHTREASEAGSNA